MAKKKSPKPKARLPRGFVDRLGADIRAQNRMLDAIAAVYERYGFEPIETPMFEYTDALGKFLPDQDRPNEGVFSLQDDDEQWMSLRYDMTAPLARHVAENWQNLVLPYRTWRAGYVFRNEKPGPGRFRQFMQCDADTIGAPGVQADAEMCMMMADVLEAVGVKRGDYVIRVSDRELLDGLLDSTGISDPDQRLGVLRSIDKYDRFGDQGVRSLLGQGFVDSSGAKIPGVGLRDHQIDHVMRLFEWEITVEPAEGTTIRSTLSRPNPPSIMGGDAHFGVAQDRLSWVKWAVGEAGYGDDRIRIDPSVVRGLEYHTGMVYEAELTFPVVNEKGEEVVFGSVGGGGRYDGLVSRFRGETVPACGFSIGVSRLQTALKNLGKLEDAAPPPLVVVCVMDKNEIGAAQALTAKLREAAAWQSVLREGGARDAVPFRCEMFQGNPKNFGKQLQYADRRGAALAVFQGSDEREAGTVVIKDLIEGRREAEGIASNEEWRAARPGQRTVPETVLVDQALETLRRQRSDAIGEG